MIVSIHQPIYLPWLAYFDKIRRSDVHVILDHVTVGKQDFCNRNKIRIEGGWDWLNIPIKNKGSRTTPVNMIEIAEDGWQQKQIGRLRENYRNAPFWGKHEYFLKHTLRAEWTLLRGPVNTAIGYMIGAFGIKTKILFSSDIPGVKEHHKSDLNLHICKELGATEYLSGPFGRDYLEVDKFNHHGIVVRYTDFQHPIYPQQYPGFISGLSALDALFNTGGFPT